ncbi:hypothetical protein [uncultured Mediterranean phage uvDeep-CGR2-KM18-C269]|nr:hypothetical protein [uncultured Mediterranean phage uvDeep-CGR2-KM18-C269]
MTVNQITKNDFMNFEQVRRFSSYTMYDPRSRQLTGLSKERYVCIIENYSALLDKYSDAISNDEWRKNDMVKVKDIHRRGYLIKKK